jgi:hypothetical protein
VADDNREAARARRRAPRAHCRCQEEGDQIVGLVRGAPGRECFVRGCRLTGNQLVSTLEDGRERSFLVAKGAFRPPERAPAPLPAAPRTPTFAAALPAPAPAPAIPPLAVMGIGSWPRPRWLQRLLHERLSGRVPDD